MENADAQNVLFTPYAQACIRFKARQLSRRSEFRRCDEHDLRQELWLILLREAHRFDPRRASLNTFIDRVVQSAAGMIVRRPYRQKRVLDQKAVSLDRIKVVTGDGRQALADFVSSEDISRRTGAASCDETACHDAADAFGHTIGAMPDEVRDVCRQVMRGSISSAARELGISRRRVRKALQAARTYFERAGFDGRCFSGQFGPFRHT